MLFLAVPSMHNVLLNDPLHSTASRIATVAQELRADAVRDQVVYVLHFDLNRNNYWISSKDMTAEKEEERQKNAALIPEGIKITDLYHVGEEKKDAGEFQVLFYKSGVAQPAVIHLSSGQKEITMIIEPFLNKIKVIDRYVEYPGNGDNN
jgi:Tfp pilus assembly protein FimT